MNLGLNIIHSQQDDWDHNAWNTFVKGHPAAHVLQFSQWGQLKSEFGWQNAIIGMEENGQLVAGTQLLFRKLPRLGFLPFVIAYIPKGPLVDWNNTSQVQTLFDAIHRISRKHGALLLKIEPELVDTPELAEYVHDLGFQPSTRTIQPRTTVWLDLTADEDTLLARMKQKWRYNVRLATRKGVTVREGNATDLASFSALMATTGERNEFGVHTAGYYQRFWELFTPGGEAALLIAEHEGRALAALMVAWSGQTAYYLYGASSSEGRSLMPSHLLQWETMLWAKARGCTTYDMWGVPDEVGLDPETPIPDNPGGLWGVWRFKRGFGGQIVRYTGAWDHTYFPGLSPFLR